MEFACEACGGTELDQVTEPIELSPDGDSDEMSMTIGRCTKCRAPTIRIYEESRRGSLDSESWRISYWPIDESKLRIAIGQRAACPAPRSRNCRCVAHRNFSDYRRFFLGQSSSSSP